MANDTDLHDERVSELARASFGAPRLIALDELGVIAVDGADAIAFLQSQLTSDVARLRHDQLALAGYCTAKGRLLATFHQWRHDDAILLRLPREILPAVVKRLSMFVLRSKARLTDASAQWTTHALIGAGLNESARQHGVALPAAAWTAVHVEGLRIDRVPDADGLERYLLTAPAGSALPAWSAAFARSAAALWWWSEIAAAVPTVFAATQEKFVPQMINFEVVGGVDFHKGCYPGQEVVARSQYLGKLKRRMQRGHVPAPEVSLAADVHHADASQAVGTVVMAAPAPGGGTELLFELPLDRAEAGKLHVTAPEGPLIELRPLPYPFVDPTA
jgi:tRNA-modifying protein YgfZ